MNFAYNNAKNMSTSHILFKLNYEYHLHILSENDTDPCLKSYSAKKLIKKLRYLLSFTSKIYSILRNYNNKYIIIKSSHKAISIAKSFGSIVNTLQPSGIKISKTSFLAQSKFYVL